MKKRKKIIRGRIHLRKIRTWNAGTQLSLFLFLVLLISVPLFVLSSQQQTQTKQLAQAGIQCGGPGAPYHCANCSNPSGTLHGVCGKLCCVSNSGGGGGGPAKCSPQGSAGIACGGAGDGSTGRCCGGATNSCHGVCGNLQCCPPSNKSGGGGGTPATPGTHCGNNGTGTCQKSCKPGDLGGGSIACPVNGTCVCRGLYCCIPPGVGSGGAYVGEPCGNNGTGRCAQNPGSCPGGMSSSQSPGGNNGVCQKLVCCGATAGKAYAGESCGNNGTGRCASNKNSCPQGMSSNQNPGGNNGVCQNLVCCSPAAGGGTSYVGESCGGGGKGTCQKNPQFCPSGTSSNQSPNQNNGICQNLVCCYPPIPTTPPYSKPPDNGAGCPKPGDTCSYSQGNGCFSGTGASGFNGPGCKYSCGPVQCPGGPPVKVAPPVRVGGSVPVGGGIPVVPASGIGGGGIPAKGGTASSGAPGSYCIVGTVSGVCASAGGPPGSGNCQNVGSSQANKNCQVGFCCLQFGKDCASKNGQCQPNLQGSACSTSFGASDCPTNTICCLRGSYLRQACRDIATAQNVHYFCQATCGGNYPAYAPAGDAECAPNKCCLPYLTPPSQHSMVAYLTSIGNAQGENSNPQKKAVEGSMYAYPAKLTGNGSQPVTPSVTRGTLAYDPASGRYTNQNFPVPNAADGQYELLVHIDNYLTKRAVATDNVTSFTLPAKQTITMKEFRFIPGDIAPSPKVDNYIDVEDYNKMLGCFGKSPTGDCSVADLNSDGIIDQIDVDLLLSYFGTVGDFPGSISPKFKCVPDPICEKTNQTTLQMCALKCGIDIGGFGLP